MWVLKIFLLTFRFQRFRILCGAKNFGVTWTLADYSCYVSTFSALRIAFQKKDTFLSFICGHNKLSLGPGVGLNKYSKTFLYTYGSSKSVSWSGGGGVKTLHALR